MTANRSPRSACSPWPACRSPCWAAPAVRESSDSGGRPRRADQGRLRRRPADRGAASDRAWRAHRGGRDLGSPAAGQRPDPPPLFHRRLLRPAGPAVVPDRPQPLSGGGQPGGGQRRQRPGFGRRGAGPGQPLPAAGRDRGGLEAGLYRRRGPGPRRPGRRRPDRRRAADRPDQLALHLDPGPDQRAHRPVAVHRRGAGHRQPGRSAGGDPAGRPDLCRYPAILRRPADAEAGAGRGRGDAGQHPGSPEARGRQRLWLHRHRPVLGTDRRPEHRHGDAAGALPQSAGRAAARHVRPGAVHPGGGQQRLPGPAAGAPARHRRRRLRLGRRARATRRSGARSSRPEPMAPTGW